MPLVSSIPADATTAAGAGNNLSKLKDKVNAAYSAALAAGWSNIDVHFVWMNSKPDIDNNNQSGTTLSSQAFTVAENYVNRALAARDYLIANCSCFSLLKATTMNCAVTLTQVNAETTNYYPMIAAVNGLKFQRAGFGRADVINAWGGAYDAGLPVAPFDGTHANRAGELTKGHLLAAALVDAEANTDPGLIGNPDVLNDIVSLPFPHGRLKD